MSKALDEYLGIPHSDRESCAMDADDDSWVENYIKIEIPRLVERLNKEISKQKESFAYWIDSDVLRTVRAGKRELGATSHKDRDKGIKALEDIEKRASSVIAQVEKIR